LYLLTEEAPCRASRKPSKYFTLLRFFIGRQGYPRPHQKYFFTSLQKNRTGMGVIISYVLTEIDLSEDHCGISRARGEISPAISRLHNQSIESSIIVLSACPDTSKKGGCNPPSSPFIC
jgi:hypothetical protein